MKQLRISPDLALPLDTVTSTLVVYGGKGMGKTNLGSDIVEELTRCGLRWAWLDPLGVSWGLRHSADGTGRGVECLILGGLHGDVPIEPAGGAAVADVVVEESTNVLIDFSRKTSGEMWSIGEKITFVTAYALRLFQRQGEIKDGRRRPPLFQVLDEAARYIPQTIPSGEAELAKCVGAWNQLVEEGRNVGVGVGLLTQRSARMNKSVSELADAMIAFRTVGPNSLEAVLDWLGEHVEKARIKELAQTVRSLERGSALVVSPGWLKFEGVVKIRMRETFDSSATVKHGERARTARGEGAKPDLARIRERMAATIERAKSHDPVELQKTIRDLRGQLAKVERAKPAVTPSVTGKPPRVVEKPILKDSQVKRLEALASKTRDSLDHAGRHFAALAHAHGQLEEQIKAALAAARNALSAPPAHMGAPAGRSGGPAGIAGGGGLAGQLRAPGSSRPAPVVPRPPRGNAESDGAVSRAQQRILDALAWLKSIGIPGANRTQLALMADASPTSSSYANNLGGLRSLGLIDYGAGSTVFLTDSGLAAAVVPETPPTAEALQESILRRLEAPKGRILEQLIRVYPQGLSRPALADLASASATSSSYANNLGSLRSLGLIEYRGGEVFALPVLFLEGAA
jgi:hypothetical protein